MVSVSYPDLQVSFQQALAEVFNTYLLDGGLLTWLGTDYLIHRCELHFSKDLLQEVSDRPKVAILGSRPSTNGQSPGKCFDGGRRVIQKEAQVDRMIHVVIPRGKIYDKPPYTGDKQEADKEMADQVWQNLLLITHAARIYFRQRGIWTITLDEFPQENSDAQFWVNSGRLRCDVRYNLPFES